MMGSNKTYEVTPLSARWPKLESEVLSFRRSKQRIDLPGALLDIAGVVKLKRDKVPRFCCLSLLTLFWIGT